MNKQNTPTPTTKTTQAHQDSHPKGDPKPVEKNPKTPAGTDPRKGTADPNTGAKGIDSSPSGKPPVTPSPASEK